MRAEASMTGTPPRCRTTITAVLLSSLESGCGAVAVRHFMEVS